MPAGQKDVGVHLAILSEHHWQRKRVREVVYLGLLIVFHSNLQLPVSRTGALLARVEAKWKLAAAGLAGTNLGKGVGITSPESEGRGWLGIRSGGEGRVASAPSTANQKDLLIHC